jgi:asparagine synthase (glutamine-hydrolysing)
MCGITGFVNLHGERADAGLARASIQRIAHRGPDESGVHVDGPCAFGHARLSIVDLAAGQQPMSTQDGRYWIVFNGEIFNHVELRERLIAKGHPFRTRCDTEVILQLYQAVGKDCVYEMNGQWAFAIWDTKEQTLFMSRDRMGIRPLYYMKTPEHFIFGSEIKTIFCHPGASRRLNLRGLDDVLTIWSTTSPQTMFEGVLELPPGHSLWLAGDEVRVERFWELDYTEPESGRSEEDYAQEVLELLIDAARLRFQSADVPVGAYLSGGLDSTLVTSIVRRFTNAPLRTFSVVFEDAEFDESSYQRQAIDYLRVDHQQVLCRKQDIAEHFADVIWHTEQPVVRTAPAPMYLLARLVRECGFKVVLTGEGADEIFGGYDIFKEAKVRRFWARQPKSKLRPLLLRKLYPYMPGLQRQSEEYLRAFFYARPEDLKSPFFSHLPRWELTRKLRAFYSEAVKESLAGYDCYESIERNLPSGYPRWNPFSQAQFLEARYLMPGYILSSQGDRMAMAHGVEGRFPFLDYRVVQLAARIPARLKMKVLNEKYLLKKAAGDLIPPFLHKRPKQPYRAPEALSFYDPQTGKARAQYVEDLLSADRVKRTGVFNPQAVQQLAEKARRGKVIGVRDGMALVSILSTQLLIEQFVEGFGKLHGAQGL